MLFSVFYHSWTSYKTYEIPSPTLFKNKEDAFKYADEIIKEHNDEIEECKSENMEYYEKYDKDNIFENMEIYYPGQTRESFGTKDDDRYYIARSKNKEQHVWIDSVEVKNEYVASKKEDDEDVSKNEDDEYVASKDEDEDKLTFLGEWKNGYFVEYSNSRAKFCVEFDKNKEEYYAIGWINDDDETIRDLTLEEKDIAKKKGYKIRD